MSLVSVLSRAAVWIPLVLSFGLSVLLCCGWCWVFAEGFSVHRPRGANRCDELLVRDREVHKFAAPQEPELTSKEKYSLGLSSDRQDRPLLVLGNRNLVEGRKSGTRAQPVTAFAQLSYGAP